MTVHSLTRRRARKAELALKLVNLGGHLASLSFELGACCSAEDADKKANDLEVVARGWAEHRGADLDRLQALELAGDAARRARLFRQRAQELRS